MTLSARRRLCILLMSLAAMAACDPPIPAAAKRAARPGVAAGPFGMAPDGGEATLYTLRNRNGMEVRVTDYGGIIVSISAPDRNGRFEDVVLGLESLAAYTRNTCYLGALVGRYGNRIADARFRLDGAAYTLAANNGPNSLHGGLRGFDRRRWDAAPFEQPGCAGVVLSRRSPDGEEGYPGNLDVRVTYTLTDADELIVDYGATTDQPTPVNLTQHTYFNLSGFAPQGGQRADVLGHLLTVHADAFTPVDERMIPTGEIRPVAGTPFDFRAPTAIGARIDAPDAQLRIGGGYDHNFVLRRPADAAALAPAARLYEPASGRVLEVLTTEPGLQVYSGNFLDVADAGHGGAVYGPRTGVALETQHFPDSPNQPHFPSAILRPQDEYRSRTVYRFGVAPADVPG